MFDNDSYKHMLCVLSDVLLRVPRICKLEIAGAQATPYGQHRSDMICVLCSLPLFALGTRGSHTARHEGSESSRIKLRFKAPAPFWCLHVLQRVALRGAVLILGCIL